MRRPDMYCQMEFITKAILDILNGDFRVTREHLRVTPQSLALFVSKLERKTHGWEVEFEAIVFLYWLATGTCFRVVCVSFQLARSTTWRICRRVLEQTVRLAATTIMLPVGDEVNVVGEGFAALAGSPTFRRAVGALDGCQIRILCPSALHDQYINRKLFYSIALQGLVDHRGMFIDICAGFPGSVHDMRVLRHSHLWRSGQYPPLGHFILGDGGYQSRLNPICIVTPFKAPLTPDQADFNHHLSKARSVVERAFGVMETRWRSIYTKALEVRLSTGVKVLAACVVMHNICVSVGDVMTIDIQNRHPERRPVQDEANGVQFRNVLLNQHTANRHQEAEAINDSEDEDMI
jgi:ribosomal protein S12